MVNVAPDPNEACNRTITVYGQSGTIPPGGTEQQPLELFVGNAGTAARFLSAFVCLGRGVYRLHGVPRMHERPQAALFKALRELGYRVESENGNDKLPVRIWSVSTPLSPRVTSGERVGERGDLENVKPSSPQPSPPEERERSVPVRSALRRVRNSPRRFCSARKLGIGKSKSAGENAEESPYVAMTTKLIKVFRATQGGIFQIEPDACSGSYFCAAVNGLDSTGKARDNLHDDIVVRIGQKSTWQMDSQFHAIRACRRFRMAQTHNFAKT